MEPVQGLLGAGARRCSRVSLVLSQIFTCIYQPVLPHLGLALRRPFYSSRSEFGGNVRLLSGVRRSIIRGSASLLQHANSIDVFRKRLYHGNHKDCSHTICTVNMFGLTICCTILRPAGAPIFMYIFTSLKAK